MNFLSSKEIFDQFGGGTNKKLGQNFLFDANINRRIVSVAGDLSHKVVVEIGPGPGGLTLEILQKSVKKLYVIEFDKHWADVWRKLKNQYFGDKLEVIECDALSFDLQDISPNVIVSNLPYNISTQLLFRWLPEFHRYEKLVLMFQKEVADRLYARPSTKSYGRLSVLSQSVSVISKAFDLEPGSFFPAPKVKSTVVKFEPFSEPSYSEKLSNILTDAFCHRRKVVSKSLKKYFADPDTVLQNLGYKPNARAEEISVNDYLKMICLSSQEIVAS
jgi:16S rRNA (adenine1518-N6/adenine1519-N6)-dimethyltransferase